MSVPNIQQSKGDLAGLPESLSDALARASLGEPPHWAGSLELCAATPRVAIIGTRKPSPTGLAVTEAIAGQLAAAGALVVSGSAVGTDMAAHRAALDRGRPTVAIIPCGLGRVPWPDWRRPFAAVGPGPLLLLLSPFPIRQILTRQTPVIRNRLIAALAHAVVVGEAGINSGTHHCVAAALGFGVPVFFLHTGEEEPRLAEFHRELQRRGATPFAPDDAWGPDFPSTVFRAATGREIQLRRDDAAQLRLFPESSAP